MKQVFFALIPLTLTLGSCKNNMQQYAEYNDAIVEQVEMADSTLQILFSFEEFDQFPERKASYSATFSGIQKNLTQISWEEEDSLRQAALDLVDTYQSIVDQEYTGIYTLMHDTIYTAEDSSQVDALSKDMYARWQISSEYFASVQGSFSKRYGINLKK
jgi:hypothetical protein